MQFELAYAKNPYNGLNNDLLKDVKVPIAGTSVMTLFGKGFVDVIKC